MSREFDNYIHPAKALSTGYILCVPQFFRLQAWISRPFL